MENLQLSGWIPTSPWLKTGGHVSSAGKPRLKTRAGLDSKPPDSLFPCWQNTLSAHKPRLCPHTHKPMWNKNKWVFKFRPIMTAKAVFSGILQNKSCRKQHFQYSAGPHVYPAVGPGSGANCYLDPTGLTLGATGEAGMWAGSSYCGLRGYRGHLRPLKAIGEAVGPGIPEEGPSGTGRLNMHFLPHS